MMFEAFFTFKKCSNVNIGDKTMITFVFFVKTFFLQEKYIFPMIIIPKNRLDSLSLMVIGASTLVP